ncbi:hypothetical protein CLUG_04240 [Clavispora lusitaniae ATCC 42720]|uniref:Magnesium-dependent phosphatase n=1 Tax=Clavispora lusitaniae (strain ATCC 42720) TaxID=306902 RepID=C4Y7R2_CLAL4|nr:uncharacterized protein CLUG_04240 [Clavispora lusitaniae ATCC 42720]EEQ40112.1 hypothetical protein CLUG_04240 [Clavispora lusitaniae ATCC 42720]
MKYSCVSHFVHDQSLLTHRKYNMSQYDYPQVIVFDLDYTLWPWWCDCHISPPIQKVNNARLTDESGTSLSLFRDVESILLELATKGITIVGASRTATPEIALEILSLLHVGERPMIDYFSSLQWGQGSKKRHIKQALKELKMEKCLENGSVILFDDESRNKDVCSINCHFALITDYESGLTRDFFEQSLRAWTKKKGH